MRSSGRTSKATKQKSHHLLLWTALLRNMYLRLKAKIMSEGKIKMRILWQLDSCKRKKPIFEKIARELQEEVEYIRTFAEKRKKIQSTHEGR